MKKLIFAWLVAVFATSAWANCTTSTYTYQGRMVTCTTCCFGGVCNTNCF